MRGLVDEFLRWFTGQEDPTTHVSEWAVRATLGRRGYRIEEEDAYSLRFIHALRERIRDGILPSRPLVRSRPALVSFRDALRAKRTKEAKGA